MCKSCGQSGHNSARFYDCPNHEFTLVKLLKRHFPNSRQWYTKSLPLNYFIISNDGNSNKLTQYQDRIVVLFSFLRQVIYKAQILVNHYILNNPSNLPNEMF